MWVGTPDRERKNNCDWKRRGDPPHIIGRYRDGVRVGMWRMFDPAGHVVDEVDHGEGDLRAAVLTWRR